MRVNVARRLHLTTDWGLEIGMLSEIYRDHSTRQICQVDIADIYDHKHQSLGKATPEIGLNRMCRDIALGVLEGLAARGQVLDLGRVRAVVTAYQRIVLDLMDSYADVAAINGLTIDRVGESLAASTFAESLYQAGRSFVEEDCYGPLTPTWDEVIRNQPDILVRLQSAVALDRAEYGQFCN